MNLIKFNFEVIMARKVLTERNNKQRPGNFQLSSSTNIVTKSPVRAKGDRNLTQGISAKKFEEALVHYNFSGMTILDFGCGDGDLTQLFSKLPENKRPKKIIAFELEENLIKSEKIITELKRKLSDVGIELTINPTNFIQSSLSPDIPTNHDKGDLRVYDYEKILSSEEVDQYAIVGNPPYFLWDRSCH